MISTLHILGARLSKSRLHNHSDTRWNYFCENRKVSSLSTAHGYLEQNLFTVACFSVTIILVYKPLPRNPGA
jgi:hypothetical protein